MDKRPIFSSDKVLRQSQCFLQLADFFHILLNSMPDSKDSVPHSVPVFCLHQRSPNQISPTDSCEEATFYTVRS